MLVCEKIADAGVAHLSELFSVDLGLDWTKDELFERIADYDAIVAAMSRALGQASAEIARAISSPPRVPPRRTRPTS